MIKLKNKEIIDKAVIERKYLIDTIKILEGLKRKLQIALRQKDTLNM